MHCLSPSVKKTQGQDKSEDNMIQLHRVHLPCFCLPIDPDHLDEIAREKLKFSTAIENSIVFLLSDRHIFMAINICLCKN
jgi:hypothetical protein